MSAVPQVELGRTLRRWDLRRRLLGSLIWLPRGILMAVLVGLGVALISRWRPWLVRDEVLAVTGIAVVVAVVGVLALVWLRPRSLVWLARHFDQRFELKERVSTALELANGTLPPAPDLSHHQLEDTRQIIRRVSARRKLPLKPRYRDLGLLSLAVLALAFVLQLDNPLEDQILSQRAVENEIQQQIQALEQTREDILGNEELSEEEKQQLLEPLEEALETLQEPKVSREEAVAALSEAEQKLREEADGFSEDQEQAFEAAGQRMGESDTLEDAGEALSEGDLNRAADELQQLGKNLANEQLTPEEMQALADQLEQAAEALDSVNPEAAEALRQAAEALRDGDLQAAQEALSEAAEALREQQEAAQNTPQAEQAQQAAQQGQSSRDRIAQAGQDQRGQQQAQQNQQGQQQAQNQQSQQGQPSQQGQQQSQQGQPSQQGQQSQQGQPSQQGQQSQQGQLSQQGQQSQQGQPGQQGSQLSQQSGSSLQTFLSGAPSAGDEAGGAGSDTAIGPQSNEQIQPDDRPGENEGLKEFDSIFAPQRIGETGSETPLSLQGQPQGDDADQVLQGGFNEQFQGTSQITYQEVYADYVDRVNQSLETDYIPIGMKDVIRNYFTSLEP